eukprot:TRINITY_DN5377_c0_g1_i1.p1 TRINITY_DN5377_c0_g1~~TRINITY_DN5377_c0_g1_i1.p1  ORF type:complete len:179 (-),score=45.32 TRINITY_DN5377_c0_g1_i1:90-626(-)
MGVAKRKRRKVKKQNGMFKVSRDKKRTIPKLNMGTAKTKQIWKDGRSLKKNYQNLGISYNPSETVLSEQIKISYDQYEGNVEFDEDGLVIIHEDVQGKNDLKDLLEIPEPAPPQEKKLGTTQRFYWKRLYDKHGDNYQAMAMDIKLNTLQHAKKACKKFIALYKEKYLNNDQVEEEEE